METSLGARILRLMAEEPQKDPLPGRENRAPIIDMVDLKKNVGGIGVLIVICGILWLLSSFGPKGASWISNQTTELLGVNRQTAPAVSKVAETHTEAAKVMEMPGGTSKIEIARAQILEALGGPEKVVVKHVAISKDEKSLVAGVIFLDAPTPTKLVEIYFDQDEFDRYISVPDSPVPQEIKIWIQQ